MKKQKSFTLIELSVVIAILGLIASIVLVAVSRVREKAKIAAGLQFSSDIHHALGAWAVGIWDFDEGLGATTWRDSSGYRNHGSCSGASCPSSTSLGETPSGKGYALSFDGNNNYIDCGADSSLNLSGKNITIMAWVLAKDFPAGGHPDYYDMIVTKDDDVTDGFYGLGIRKLSDGDTPHLVFKTHSNGISYKTGSSSATPVVANTWYHVVGVNNGTSNLIYVNGVFKHSIASDVIGGLVTDSLYVGYHPHPDPIYAYYLNGVIDDVRIYEQALTSAQIKKLYVEGAREKGLLAEG